MTSEGPNHRRLILLRACQIATSRGLKKPGQCELNEAYNWARFTIDGFVMGDEAKAAAIIKFLEPEGKAPSNGETAT
jgi:hypothetical protein